MFLTPMDAHDKMRLRAAAFRATKVYPGVVGEFLSREILSWEEFGYRLGSSAQVRALVDHILKTDIPEIPPSRYGGGGGGDGRPATTSAVGYGG